MATRRPVALVSGRLTEIPAGDTIDPAVTPPTSVRTVTGNTTAIAGEELLCDTTSTSIIVTLPTYVSGQAPITVIKTSASNTLTVNPPAGKTINGDTSAVGTLAYSGGVFAGDGSGNYVVGAPPAAGGISAGGTLAEATATTFSTTSTYPTFVDVTGLTGVAAVVPASGSLRITLYGMLVNDTAGDYCVYQVLDEASTVILSGSVGAIYANEQLALPESTRKLTGLTPGATKTYKVQLCVLGGGTGYLGAATGGSGLRVEAA